MRVGCFLGGGAVIEQEWLTCSDPSPMFQCLKVGPDRRFRLFACACVRRIWQLLDDERPRQAVLVAEQFADGMASREELKKAHSCARVFALRQERQTLWVSCFAAHAAHKAAFTSRKCESKYEDYACTAAISSAVLAAASAAKGGLRGDEGNERYHKAEVAERAAQSELLRDIFGNPFRPVAFAENWHHPDAIALAKTIYEEGSFDRMPFLADTLELVGCNDTDILSHCREDGSHVKGCWVVDLVLGKT